MSACVQGYDPLPRTQGFLNEDFQSGEGPGKLWSLFRLILQELWSMSLRAGFLEIKIGGGGGGRRLGHERKTAVD